MNQVKENVSLKRALAAVALMVMAVTASGSTAFAQEKLKPIREVFEPAGHFPQDAYGKVAVVQWAPAVATPLGVSKETALEFKRENWRSLDGYIRTAAAAGAELIVTPEFGTVGYPDIPELPSEDDEYRSREDIQPYVETVPGPTTEYFSGLASELGVYIHVGLAEVDPVTDAYYNTVVALNPSGEIVARYRKINLYDGENDFLSPGSEIVTYSGPFGMVGLIICADVYSGTPMDELADAGVQVLALSTSWAQWNTGMTYFRRGAVQVSAYLLAANQNYFPDSGVVNPDGSLQSHIRQSDGLAYGYLPRVK